MQTLGSIVARSIGCKWGSLLLCTVQVSGNQNAMLYVLFGLQFDAVLDCFMEGRIFWYFLNYSLLRSHSWLQSYHKRKLCFDLANSLFGLCLREFVPRIFISISAFFLVIHSALSLYLVIYQQILQQGNCGTFQVLIFFSEIKGKQCLISRIY